MVLKKKEKQAITILKKKAGNVSLTCEAMNMSRDTFYEWKKKSIEFAAAVEEVNESLIDFVESKLMENINNNDNASTIFFLKTKGKQRGYVEKQEIEHSGLDGIKIEYMEPEIK